MKNTPMARFVLALVLSLIAATRPGIAQPPPEAPEPEPTLELDLGSGYQRLGPNLILISFALRNVGTEPLIVAQLPGLSFSFSCSTGNGVLGVIAGGVACVREGAFLELRPGATLLGEKVVEIPEECAGDVTVWGEFQTLTAAAWDFPARQARITSKSLPIGKAPK
ncbi:MAG: hypothetical protein ACJ76N_32315 [Thermoanaerobaculia bacterium]